MKRLFTILFLLPLFIQAQTFSNQVVPVTPADFYANDRTSPIDMLFDGDLTVSNNWVPCYSMHVDTLQIVYDFPTAQHVTVRSIKIYDGQGSNTYPTKYYLKNAATGVVTLAGSFDGSGYGVWQTITVSSPVENSQLIIKGGTGSNYGVEMQIVGDYTAYTRPTSFAARTASPFKNYLGVNSYWWNYQQDDAHPGDASRVWDNHFVRIQNSFGLVRFFSDIDQWVPHDGQFALSPLRDGWRPDSVFKRNQNAGITTLLCLQGNTGYQRASYKSPAFPDTTTYGPFHDYDPVIKSNYPARDQPATYKDRGQAAYAIAAKFGSNASADTSVFNLWNYAADGLGYYAPQSKGPGLNTLHYICFVNEQDKYWKGDSAYLWGRALAAMYSACADGNKGALGPGVGAWNADPNMKIVFSAFAVATVDQLRGAIDWCIDNRGYNPDGTVNVPWNIIDYHDYSFDSPDQYGANHTGVAPELSSAMKAADNFMYAANRYLNGMPIWITEFGYDTAQTSPLHAHAIGTMNKLQVHGAWNLRSCLEYSAKGLQAAVTYQLFDDSQNPAAFSTQFETSGLLNYDATFTRRPAADYYMQALNILGNYTFSQRVNSYPRVDKYTLSGQHDMYAVWVPDSLDVHTTYNLSVAAGATVTIRQLKDGQDVPNTTIVTATTGTVTLNVTEIPMIVEVSASASGGGGAPNQISRKQFKKYLKIN